MILVAPEPISHPIWTLITGSLGSAIVTLGLYLIKVKSDRVERTFSLHREFSSLEFMKVRTGAYHLLANHHGESFGMLAHKALVDEKVSEGMAYLSRLLTFYEHLSISIRAGYLDRKLACSYFGMVFYWWNANYFTTPRGLATTTWEVRRPIAALQEYFGSHAAKRDLRAWKENASLGAALEPDPKFVLCSNEALGEVPDFRYRRSNSSLDSKPILEKLGEVDTRGIPRRNCLVQASWLFTGGSSIDHFDSVECPPRSYGFYLTLSASGLGCCYADEEPFTLPDPGWVGKDARTISAPSLSLRISLLDSIFSNFESEPKYVRILSGTPQEKAAMRAQVIANELNSLARGLKLKNARVLMIGVVGRVMSAMSELGLKVSGVDMDPEVVGQISGGIPVADSSMLSALIPAQDIVLVTGMTVANSSLDAILHQCGSLGVPIVLYAETGANFAPFYVKWGVASVISESFPIYTIPGYSHIAVHRQA